MSREHECPYNGYMVNAEDGPWACGIRGALCHRCREDRADRRAVLHAATAGVIESWMKVKPEVALDWLATGEWPDTPKPTRVVEAKPPGPEEWDD